MIEVIVSHIKRILPLLRLIPSDTSTLEGRSQERHRRILLTAASSGFAKMIAMATVLVTVPITLNYLGTERFGLWMTITSGIAMLGFADLGIGNSLMNAVAKTHGKDDQVSGQQYIVSAGVILSTIAVLILVVFFLVYPYVYWPNLFNIESPLAIAESGPAVVTLFVCFALNIPAAVVQRVQMGLQMGLAANLWQSGGSLLTLFAVFGVTYLQGGLPWLVGALAGAPLLILLLNTVFFFKKPNAPNLKLSFFKWDKAKHLICSGGLFFLLQMSALITFQSAPLIIANYLGAEAVATYSVASKLFSIPIMFVSFITMALWPAYAEARSRGDSKWIRKSFYRSLKYSAIINMPMTFIFLVFGQSITRLWVGPSIAPSWDLMFGLAIWSLLITISANLAALLNGLHVIKFQVVTATLMAISTIGLSVLLVQWVGLSGVVYAATISLTIFTLIPTMYCLNSFLECPKKG